MTLSEVVLVVGHDAKSKGAYSDVLKKYEYDYCLEVANLVGCDVVTHKPGLPYVQKMQNTYKDLDKYNLTLELHFNAANGIAQGSEALHFYKNKVGALYAAKYAELFSREYGITNRSSKPLSKNDRGYWAVASGKPTGLILEPFFGDEKQAERFSDAVMHAEVLRKFIFNL